MAEGEQKAQTYDKNCYQQSCKLSRNQRVAARFRPLAFALQFADNGSEIRMVWTRRILLGLPVAMASVLTLLISVSDRFHLNRQHIAGYCFLFGTPWAWLLDRNWFPNVQSHWLNSLIGFAVMLWIPALLYTTSLWIVFRALQALRHRVAS